MRDDAVPDETTLLYFRRLLERHNLPEAIFASVGDLLEARGILLTTQARSIQTPSGAG